jgi:hypothetical protein
MGLGGRAWRGYFPVGGELTSGTPDLKEGLYFGAEFDDDHPLVRAGTPMHGRNLFPFRIPLLRRSIGCPMTYPPSRREGARGRAINSDPPDVHRSPHCGQGRLRPIRALPPLPRENVFIPAKLNKLQRKVVTACLRDNDFSKG